MFERFSDRARQIVVFAQEEARLLGHNYIGTEHLLLGILRQDANTTKALGQKGVTLEVARVEVEKWVGRGKGSPEGHIPFTIRHKKVLELALREALLLGHNYIGPEHQLLALLKEGEGVGVQALTALNVDLNALRVSIIKDMIGNSQRAGRSSVEDVLRMTRSRAEIERDIESHETALEILRAELKTID